MLTRIGRALRDWPVSAVDLVWGILKRFYLWVYPFGLVQPVDILGRVGLHLSIPEQTLAGLVGIGLFASAVDVLREKRSQLADAAAREDARGIAGTIEFSPFLMPIGAAYEGAWFRPLIRLDNHGSQPVMYVIQSFDAKIQTFGRIYQTPAEGSSDEEESRYFEPESGSTTGPSSLYTIAPNAYMDVGGPTSEFGPFPGLGNPIDVEYEIVLRLSRPFSNSTLLEHRYFAFRAFVQDGRKLKGKGPGEVGAAIPSYTSSQEQPVYVPSRIDADIVWPEFPRHIAMEAEPPIPVDSEGNLG